MDQNATLDLSPQKSFGYRLWMLRHAWTRRVEAVLQPTGLTHMQFFMLRMLSVAAETGETPSQVRLADALMVDRMTVSTVLRTLEAKGLIRRGVHPQDPRANLVELTPAGAALNHDGAVLVTVEQERFFGRLGPARQEAFSTMLDDLLDQEQMRMSHVREHA